MYNIFYILCTCIFLKFSLYLVINLISESEILNSHRRYLNGLMNLFFYLDLFITISLDYSHLYCYVLLCIIDNMSIICIKYIFIYNEPY